MRATVEFVMTQSFDVEELAKAYQEYICECQDFDQEPQDLDEWLYDYVSDAYDDCYASTENIYCDNLYNAINKILKPKEE